MLWHADFIEFKLETDHEGLTRVLDQKNLSGRQTRWLEKIDFEVAYAPGSESMLADALSHIFSDKSPGAVEAHSEYAYLDVVDNDTSAVCERSKERFVPVVVRLEARVMTRRKPPRSKSESSRDSAEWIMSHFLLHDPPERKEGGSTTESAEGSTGTAEAAEPENSPVASNELQSSVMIKTSAEGSTAGPENSPVARESVVMITETAEGSTADPESPLASNEPEDVTGCNDERQCIEWINHRPTCRHSLISGSHELVN